MNITTDIYLLIFNNSVTFDGIVFKYNREGIRDGVWGGGGGVQNNIGQK